MAGRERPGRVGAAVQQLPGLPGLGTAAVDGRSVADAQGDHGVGEITVGHRSCWSMAPSANHLGVD